MSINGDENRMTLASRLSVLPWSMLTLCLFYSIEEERPELDPRQEAWQHLPSDIHGAFVDRDGRVWVWRGRTLQAETFSRDEQRFVGVVQIRNHDVTQFELIFVRLDDGSMLPQYF